MKNKDPILDRIELSWSQAGISPGYLQIMRRAIAGGKGRDPRGQPGSSRWARLPGLCCQAAGGDARAADDLAAAWLVFYLAADLMDRVEDRDDPDSWWAQDGPALALNTATGLFFNAARSLNRLYRNAPVSPIAGELIDEILVRFLQMSDGQQLDLAHPEPTLEQYWHIAAKKSGAFFALACRAGACLATDNPDTLSHLEAYGRNLGVLVQIGDDIDDLIVLSQGEIPAGIHRSLPAVFIRQVSAEGLHKELKQCISAKEDIPRFAARALEIIEDSGATLYLLTEIERYAHQALTSLSKSNPQPQAGEALASYIHQLSSADLRSN